MDLINLNSRQKDEVVEGIVLVKTAQVRTSSNGSNFLDITVMDLGGEMNAKSWNWGESPAPQPNSAIRIKGLVHEFMGKLQLRIDRLRPATEEEVDWALLVPSAPEPPEKMYDELMEAASSIQDENLRTLAQYLLEERKESLLVWPAAVSYHHAVRGGLLQHTLTMLKAAKALFQVYTDLNEDLVLCGVIAHDLCKIDEINASELGIAAEYTPEGMLLGHLVLGVARIGRIGEALSLNKETVLLVQHMVLSHHETPEYGSPRPPMFPEAELLHHLDVLDARMYEMRYALQTTPEGSFSERIRSLENRKLYKTKTGNAQQE